MKIGKTSFILLIHIDICEWKNWELLWGLFVVAVSGVVIVVVVLIEYFKECLVTL